MLVRLAQEHDLRAFDTFSRLESLGTGWGPAAFRDAFDNPQYRLWVAAGDASLKGFLVARVVAGEAELLNIVVASTARRMGIGRSLMHSWVEQMQQERAERLFLEVRVSNIGAIKLYESFGFSGTGKRVGYYQPDLEDALVMARSL